MYSFVQIQLEKCQPEKAKKNPETVDFIGFPGFLDCACGRRFELPTFWSVGIRKILYLCGMRDFLPHYLPHNAKKGDTWPSPNTAPTGGKPPQRQYRPAAALIESDADSLHTLRLSTSAGKFVFGAYRKITV